MENDFGTEDGELLLLESRIHQDERNRKKRKPDIPTISFCVINTGLILYLSFCYYHISNISDTFQIFSGTNSMLKNGSIYFASGTSYFNRFNHFTTLFLLINSVDIDKSSEQKAYLTVTCQSPKNGLTIFNEADTLSVGKLELYTTWYSVFDHIIVEVCLTGYVLDRTSLSLLMIQSTKEFEKSAESIRKNIRLIMLFLIFIFSLYWAVFSKHPMNKNQILILVSAFICALSNISLGSWSDHQKPVLTLHYFVFLVRGLLIGMNVILLFFFSLDLNEKSYNTTYIIVSFLYILSEILSSVSSDSYITSTMLGGDSIIWTFFSTMVIIFKISISLATIHNFTIGFLKSRSRNKYKVILNGIAFVFLYFPMLSRLMQSLVDGFQSSSLNILTYSVSQALFSLTLVQIHSPRRK